MYSNDKKKIYYDVDSLEELYNDDDNNYKSNVIEEYEVYGSRKYEKSDYDKAFGQKYVPKKGEYYELNQKPYDSHKPKYIEKPTVTYEKKVEKYNPYTDNNGASDYV